MTGNRKDGAYQIGVLARTYAVLELVAAKPRTVNELSDAMEVDSRTVYRIVRNLETNGFVRRTSEDRNRFALGFELIRLGKRAGDQVNLAAIATEALSSLALTTGESALLSIRSGCDVVFVKRIDGSNPLRLSVEEGTRRPLPMGAAAKVLTAYADKGVVRQIVARPTVRGDGGVSSSEDLEKLLTGIMEDGFATSASESTPGAGSVAAPITGPTGEVVGAVSIGGPVERVLGAGAAPSHIEKVRVAARQVSEDLKTPSYEGGLRDQGRSEDGPSCNP